MAGEEILCMAYGIPFVVLLVIRIIAAVWISKDAKAHGIDPLMYVILGFLLGIIGLIIYWVFREDVYKKRTMNQTRQHQMSYQYQYQYPTYYQAPPPAYGHGTYGYGAQGGGTYDTASHRKEVICNGCGHIITRAPFGNSVFCENCGKEVRVQ